MAIKITWQSVEFIGINVPDAKAHYEAALKTLWASATACKIIEFITNHKIEILLLCVKGGEGQFLFPGEWEEIKKPTIIWDPNKDFLFYSDVQICGNDFYADKCAFPPAIVLAHEMGHAKQWLEDNPHGYEALVRSREAGVAAIESDNLARHETPVAKELGKRTRSHYKHFPGSGIDLGKFKTIVSAG